MVAQRAPKRHCAACGAEDNLLKPCMGCKSVYYCGPQCQTNDWSAHKGICLLKRCKSCGKIGQVLPCTGCRSVAYCGTECQRDDWAGHKPVCTKIRKGMDLQKAEREVKKEALQDMGREDDWWDETVACAVEKQTLCEDCPEKAYSPGRHVVVQKVFVSETLDPNSTKLSTIWHSTSLDVLEIKMSGDGKFTRGRIEKPVPGWVSLTHNVTGKRLVRAQTECEEELEITLTKDYKQILGFETVPCGATRMISAIIPGAFIDKWNKENPAEQIEVGDHLLNMNGVENDATQLLAELTRFGYAEPGTNHKINFRKKDPLAEQEFEKEDKKRKREEESTAEDAWDAPVAKGRVVNQVTDWSEYGGNARGKGKGKGNGGEGKQAEGTTIKLGDKDFSLYEVDGVTLRPTNVDEKVKQVLSAFGIELTDDVVKGLKSVETQFAMAILEELTDRNHNLENANEFVSNRLLARPGVCSPALFKLRFAAELRKEDAAMKARKAKSKGKGKKGKPSADQ